MDYDAKKADEIALALLHLNLMEDKYGFRAWKSISWEIMDSLHEKGYVGNPATKAKSVMATVRSNACTSFRYRMGRAGFDRSRASTRPAAIAVARSARSTF